jgi:hypothetical protein
MYNVVPERLWVGMIFEWDGMNGKIVGEIIERGNWLIKIKRTYLGMESEIFVRESSWIDKIKSGKVKYVGPNKRLRFIEFGEQQTLIMDIQ